MAEKYSVQQQTLETVLGFIKSGQIAIPEIQRPFVWKPVQVRDLIDSIYGLSYRIPYYVAKSNDEVEGWYRFRW